MAGYCIGLFKYMRMDENLSKKEKLIEKRKSVITLNGKETEHEKFLAYGEFDRIGFEKVVKFSRFRDISEKSKIWVGDRQTLLVYDIQEDECKDEVFYSEGNFYVSENDKLVRSNQLFVGITILQFKDSQKEHQAQMSDFLCGCKKEILQIIRKEMPAVRCSVLGTLGSFGLTIIWLSDQYEDILHIVTKIRNTDISNDKVHNNKSIFLSAYTIFAQNHCSGAEWNRKVRNIRGEAILRLTLKGGVSEKILKSLKKWQIDGTEIYHSVGEHDIAIRMKSANAFNLFSGGYDLDSKSDFTKENVLQSNLQLCEDIRDLKNEDFFYYKEDSGSKNSVSKERDMVESLPELESIQNEYKSLRELFKSYFPSTAGMVDTLDWLYSDYIAKISTASNEMWVSNFSYQFLKILECVAKFVKDLNFMDINKEKALQIINDLLSDFERQISHIAESNNLILGTPICQFRYSGQNNLTLYSYFGVIKSILSFIYENQQVSSQAEIVPLIVADIVPIIKSNLFFDYHNKNETRMVTINLPMMSLYDPICYYPYLLHEIFHYVVPKDRFIRNEIWGCLVFMEMLSSVCKTILVRKLQLTTNTEIGRLNIIFKDCILPYVYSFIIDYFEKYEQFQYNNCKTFGDIDKLTSTIDEYEKEILEQWVIWVSTNEKVDLSNNLIFLFFCYLFKNKKALEEKLKVLRKVGEFDNLIKGVLKFVEDLDCIVDNSVPEAQDSNFVNLMTCVGDNVFKDVVVLTDALREALVDINMINIGNVKFADYLLIFTKIKKELLLNSNDLEVDTQDIIRIGIVLDFLSLEKDDDILMGNMDDSKDAFLDMYCGMYYSTNISATNKEFKNLLIQEAEQWFVYWRTCVQIYSLRYRIYSGVFRELQEQVLQEVALDSKSNTGYLFLEGNIYWKKYVENLQSYGNYIRNNDIYDNESQWREKKDWVDKQIFDLNIEFIHMFQFQEDFSGLNKKREDRIEKVKRNIYVYQKVPYAKLRAHKILFLPNKISKLWYHWKYDISDVGQLGNLTAFIAEELKKANSRLLGKNEYPIWYRGQQSINYKLIPSLMRKYKDQKAKQIKSADFSLVKFIRREFEEFRFMADGSQEALERVGYTEGDYIALMQHYSAASNFLDWTEDALSALYFALEGFLDKKVEKTDSDAALYIFSPALYNYARKRMILQVGKDKRKLGIEKDVVKNLQDGIPNLAVSFNKGKYDMYLLGKDEYEDDNSEPYGSLQERDKKLPFYLPVAIYISRLNKRIQAQNGIFLAYNIYTSPDENDEFDYISLENIQELYFKMFKDDPDSEIYPFLYKITIKKEERKKIASWVSAFGMSKEKCYPELNNVGEKIVK